MQLRPGGQTSTSLHAQYSWGLFGGEGGNTHIRRERQTQKRHTDPNIEHSMACKLRLKEEYRGPATFACPCWLSAWGWAIAVSSLLWDVMAFLCSRHGLLKTKRTLLKALLAWACCFCCHCCCHCCYHCHDDPLRRGRVVHSIRQQQHKVPQQQEGPQQHAGPPTTDRYAAPERDCATCVP